jgi:hypothetical protein
VKVPGFIARQFYVAGSLRNTDEGFQLEAHNPLGPGTLVGVGRMSVDGRELPPEAVTARPRGTNEPISAADVSPRNPIRVEVGDRVTLHVAGENLRPGPHELDVELHELNLGRLAFRISDRLAME